MKKLALLLGLFSFMLFLGMARATTYTCSDCSGCYGAVNSGNNNIVKLTSDIQPTLNEGDPENPVWSCDVTGIEPEQRGHCIQVDKNNITIDCQGHKIYCSGSSCSHCSRGAISNYNGAGFTLINCSIQGSGAWSSAVSFDGAVDYGYFYDNIFNATAYITGGLPDGTGGVLALNKTKTLGTNIVGGNYIGGNYYSYPNGTGYSQTCSDSNNDTICDNSFAPTSNASYIDYLPLAALPIPPDTTPPAITIAAPTNVNYTTTSIALDVSADEPTDAWWYSLNGGANTTFTPNTTIAAAQGANDLFVYANDTSGNIGEASVSFFVDSIAPDIAWNTPANNSVTQNTSFIFWNVTLSETGTCELDLNSSLNITMDVNGLYCSYDFAGTNTTTYCGSVYASDAFGNMNLSSSMCVTINLSGTDLVPPNLTIISPTAITYTTSSVALTVSANEAINTWWYNLNGGENISFTPNTTISGLASGVYTLNVYASDLYGNVGMDTVTFTLQIPMINNLGFFAPIAGIAIGGGFLLFMLGLFLEEGAALARDPKKLATIAVGIVIVAVLLSALFV